MVIIRTSELQLEKNNVEEQKRIIEEYSVSLFSIFRNILLLE